MSFSGSHDIKDYIRTLLPSLNLSGEREAEIVEELAIELEEHYSRALARSLTPNQAWEEVRKKMPDWRKFAEDLQAVYGEGKAEPERSSGTLANLRRMFVFPFECCARARCSCARACWSWRWALVLIRLCSAPFTMFFCSLKSC
jgi:hypothetical protein